VCVGAQANVDRGQCRGVGEERWRWLIYVLCESPHFFPSPVNGYVCRMESSVSCYPEVRREVKFGFRSCKHKYL
jgi:hypothetical protein